MAHSSKLEQLRPLAQGEPSLYNVTGLEDMPTDELGIMLAAANGDIQRMAMEQAQNMGQIFEDMESRQYGYLGPTPDANACLQFRNSIISGKQNLKLP